MKNRTFFKIISFILIQTFLVLDICWAAAAQDIIRNLNDATLSPSLQIDRMELELIFSELSADDSGLDVVDIEQAGNFEMQLKASGGVKVPVQGNQGNVGNVTHGLGPKDLGDTSSPPPQHPLDASSLESGVLAVTNSGNDDNDDEQTEAMFRGNFAGLPVLDFRGKEGFAITAQAVADLGLDSKETSRLFTKIRIIAARYSEENRWPGFRTFNIALSDDPYAIMFLNPKDNTSLSINKDGIPDLIRLMNESQPLFVELIQSLLAHEGAIKGHGTLTPLDKEDIDWQYMNFSQIIDIIYNAIIHRNWPLSVERRGTPPSSDWKSIATTLWYGLVDVGFDPELANPFGIRWTESQANIGMADARGLRGVAVWLWFLNEYRKYDFVSSNAFMLISVEQNLAENFAFLEKQGINQEDVFLEIDKIQQEYEVLKQSRSSTIGTTLTSIALVLVSLVTAMPSWGADAAVQTAGLGGASILAIVLAGSALLIGRFVWNLFPFFKSVEKRTAQLVNQAIRKNNPSDLMAYYQSANLSDKVKIINIAAQELKGKASQVNLELFKDFFLNGLNEQSGSFAQDLRNKVKDLFKKSLNLGLNSREMSAVLNETALDTGINWHKGSSIAIEAKLANIINALVRARDLNEDAFIGAIKKDADLDGLIDRMVIKEFASKVRAAGNPENGLKIIVSDYNDRYNLGVDVNKVVSFAIGSFKDRSMGEVKQMVSLQTNADFMSAFVQAQRNAQVRVLFNNILKQIVILQETKSASLSKIITKALKEINVSEVGMFPEISILVGRLALEGNLHNPDIFVKQAESMAPIARVMNAEQMRALHNAIITLLESGYNNSDSTKLELVAAELEKAGITSSIGALTTGLAAVILGSQNGDKLNLLDTPLSQVGEKIKDTSFEAQIRQHYLFEKFNGIEQEKIKQIILNLDKILINNMALGLVFEDVNSLVAKELSSLDLKNINKQRAQLILVNTLAKGVLLNDLQTIPAGAFGLAVEKKVDELRIASVGGLSNISQVSAGTEDMVNKLRAYLNSTLNISMVLEETLETTVNNLTVQDKAEKLAATFEALEQNKTSRPVLDRKANSELTTAVAVSREEIKENIVAPEIVINTQFFQMRFLVDSAI